MVNVNDVIKELKELKARVIELELLLAKAGIAPLLKD